MTAAASPSNRSRELDRLAAIRASGGLMIATRANERVSALAGLHETGGYRIKCLAARADPLEAVMINTGGGVAGGDRIAIMAEAGSDSRLSLTTATAERIYRSDGLPTAIEISLTISPGATLAWVPQATILFSGASMRRRLSADVDTTGRLLIVETTAFGRTASFEAMSPGAIDDQWRIRRHGRLVFAEATRIDGDVSAVLGRPAVADGATVSSLLVLVAPEAGDRRDTVRAALDGHRVLGGVSAWNRLLVARLLADRLDIMSNALRSAVAALAIIPLPAAWTH